MLLYKIHRLASIGRNSYLTKGEEYMKSRWSLLFAALLILSVALAACSPEAAQQVQEAAQEVAPTIQAAAEELAPTVEAAVEEIAPDRRGRCRRGNARTDGRTDG